MSNSSQISFAIGPAMTIATVLFAVHASTKRDSPAIPSSPPLLPLILDLIKFKINWIPPYSFTSETIHATTIDITVISYIPVTPSPITLNISDAASVPVATPTISERIVPLISMINTLIPINAPTKTKTYGTTCHKLYVSASVIS